MYYTLNELRPKEHYFETDVVTCDIKGGLGNQLFMLCATLAFAKRYGKIAWFEYPSHYGSRSSYWTTLFQPFVHDRRGPIQHRYQENGFAFHAIPQDSDYLDGYFQSELYFKDQIDLIRTEMNITQHQERMKQRYPISPQSISLHLRIGDYVSLPNHHPIQTEDYYLRCMQLLTTSIPHPTVYCFYEQGDKDRASHVITRLQASYHGNYIHVNDSLQDWEEMILMSCCDHHIISNSSFSWWGAYWNTSPSKIVCYPSRWFGSAIAHDTKDLCPPEWTRIES